MNGRGLALALTLLAAGALAPALAEDAKASKPAAAPAPPAAPPAPPNTAVVERMYLERAAIAGADSSCNLFTEPERLALRSGLYQSEGELLRAGYSPEHIADMTDHVRDHARKLGCDHPSVSEVAATVRASYRQFAKTNYLDYGGANGSWGASRSEHDGWAVNETDKASGAILGLRRQTGEKPEGKSKAAALRLAVAIPDPDYTPAAVQLLGRNPNKMADPWLGSLFGRGPTMNPPPRSISRIDWAGEMKEEDDASGNTYQVFYFSPAAVAHFEELDPREAVAVEFQPSPLQKGGKTLRVVFEVGDFRAAHAFALIPHPTYPAPAGAAAPAKEH